MNVRGEYLKDVSVWRKLSLNTWTQPDDCTIHGRFDIDVGQVRAYLKEQSERTGIKCTLTNAVTKAVALTLRKYPDCNVLVRRRRLWQRKEVDIFHQVMIPVDPERGKADLSGLVIRNADQKKIHELASELREKAREVREKRDGQMASTRRMLGWVPTFLLKWVMKLVVWLSYTLNLRLPGMPRDPFGGAMVNSIGMLGIKMAYVPLVSFSRCPVVFLVGKVEERPVVVDGQVVVRPMCTITSSLDHRIIDAFQGGLFFGEVKRLLENPGELG